MSNSVSVSFIGDTQQISTDSSALNIVNLADTSLDLLSLEQCKQMFQQANSDYLLITEGACQLSPAQLQEALGQITPGDASALFLITESSQPTGQFCLDLPLSLSTLVFPLGGATHLLISHATADQLLQAAPPKSTCWQAISVLTQQKNCGKHTLPENAQAARWWDFNNLPELVPASPAAIFNWLQTEIQSLRVNGFEVPITSQHDAVALQAGLLQWHGALEESHSLSQSVQGMGRNVAGDYWHAVMHRREPDPSNSKYWYRCVGSHPIFPKLAEFVEHLLQQTSKHNEQLLNQLAPAGMWDPFAFVDFTDKCRTSGRQHDIDVATQIQAAEMLLLLLHTYHDATA